MADSDFTLPRKRRRPAKSCEQCRRRKIRCDQNLPCASCIRTRASLQCSYRTESADTSNASADTDQGALEPAQSSVLTPESWSEAVQHGAQADTIAARQDKTIRDLRRQVQQLQAQLSSSRHHQPPTPSDTTTGPSAQFQPLHRISEASAQFSQAPDACIPAVTPKLRTASDKTKLFGQSHWLHSAEKFQVAGKFDAPEIEPTFTAAQAELTSVCKETRSLRHSLVARNSVQLPSPVPDLAGTLPPKAMCDELARSYFRTFEPVYRIIHVPTFWKDYDNFWEQPVSASTPTHFLMKLVIVLAIGTTFCPETADIDRTSLPRLAQTWIYAAQWWLTGPSEKSTATVDGLQVFCLLILARQATHNCPGGSAWLSTGSLLTMAQAMGFHRNPKMFPHLSPFQVEMRARLWTTVLELVCVSSLDSSLPPRISADDFDTELPSNLNDQDLDPAGTTAPLPREGVTDSSIQILLAKSLPLRLKVVHLLSDYRNEQSYQRALKLGAELRTACRKVASFFHSSLPATVGNGSALTPTDFHRKFLDIYLRKYILLLHRPFMLQALTDPRFYLARKICVESATVIGSYSSSVNLDLETGQLDDLSRLCRVGRGVLKGPLSLDIIIVLSLEIITQLEEEGPDQSTPDPLDEMNKARRAPLVQILERISDQMLRTIAMGSPSLKRYLFLSAYLSQIRAIESGQSVKQVVYEALLTGMKKCHSLLQPQAQGAVPGNGEALGMSISGAAAVPLYQLDMGSTETDAPWDISYLLDFPLTGEDGQNSWGM